jgi:hypothetical protein
MGEFSSSAVEAYDLEFEVIVLRVKVALLEFVSNRNYTQQQFS